MSAAPSRQNLSNNELASSIINNIETVPYGMVEDDILCFKKVIGSIVKATDFAPAWKVIEKHMENGANRIEACRKNAETDNEEIT